MATAWKGAIEFGGFPVHVALHNRVKSRGSDSFKTLAPNGLPIRSVYMDTDGHEVERSDTRKGIKNGDGWTALSAEAVEAIKAADKSSVLEPRALCPMDSLDLSLSINSYKVVHDEKVAGAEKPVNQLWNILRSTDTAYVSVIAMRSGGRDSILVVFAKDDGLYAAAMPFDSELNQCPAGVFNEDAAVAKKAQAFLDMQSELVGEFEHSDFVSEYQERRADVIDKVLRGKADDIVIPETPAAKVDEPDLMAALEGAVEAAGAGKSKAKTTKTKKSSKAKTTGRKKVAA